MGVACGGPIRPEDINAMKKIMLVATCLVAGFAFAQTPSEAARQEIAQLFGALKASDCRFYRNGSWHSAQKASAHLQRKYDYLLKKGLVSSTETFIELAASKSSMSGKPYQVRCGEAAPVTSKHWFSARLREIRK